MNLSLLPIPHQDKILNLHITHSVCNALSGSVYEFSTLHQSNKCKLWPIIHLHKNF